jgi:hypothetical protein
VIIVQLKTQKISKIIKKLTNSRPIFAKIIKIKIIIIIILLITVIVITIAIAII